MVSMTETERPLGSVTWRMSDAFTMAAWCHEVDVLSVAAGFGSAENVMPRLAAVPTRRASFTEEIACARGVLRKYSIPLGLTVTSEGCGTMSAWSASRG